MTAAVRVATTNLHHLDGGGGDGSSTGQQPEPEPPKLRSWAVKLVNCCAAGWSSIRRRTVWTW